MADTPNGNGDHPAPENDWQIVGFMVVAMCSDGQIRRVPIDRTQFGKLSHFIEHKLHGGKMRVMTKPVHEESEKPRIIVPS